ncbi:MAG: PQQ-binding-like beta-propeller repeat protein [Candidatus Nealsonbacteria bacterium]|nr:PQQ-binding-like beta-propeller repeat protein [Candidatus Nealsonbacteria bacterium]
MPIDIHASNRAARMLGRLLLLLLACSQMLQTSLRAETRWPGFRGPQGTGQSADDNVPVKWGPGDIAWRTELNGQGHSSPCVWDDNIFLTGARKTESEQVERLIFCLDRNTGAVVWQQVASVGKAEVTHRMNGFASATCATDGQRVVAFFGHGGIHTYDMHGKKLWSRDLGTLPGAWGTAASPLIVDDKVIQNCDAQGESFVIALDMKTGETVWKTGRGQMPRGGWSTPLLIDVGSRRELILNGEYGVHGYDPDTGKELWFCKGFNGRGTPSPTFDRQRLFVVSSKPGDTFALRPGGSGNVRETRIVWHTPRSSGRNLSSPVLAGGCLLTANMSGIGVCYDALTGKEHWTARLEGSLTASPMAAGGLAYFQNEAGTTLVIRPGKDLDVIARNHIEPPEGEIFRSSPVPSEGQIFCRSNRALYCIGKRAAP